MPLRQRLAALAALAAFAGVSHAAPTAPSRLIVKFGEGDVEAAFSPITRVAHMVRDAGIEGRYVRRMAAGAHLVELPAGADPKSVAKAAIARGGAKFAIPDRHVKAAFVPNDTYAPQQWYLANTDVAISAYGAWDATTGSSSVVVAVVDTGILPHPDLDGRVLPGYDFVSDVDTANDGDGRDPDPTDPGDWISQDDIDSGRFPGCDKEDSSWHGTSVAGIVAANGNNGFALAGVDWGARILPVRALGKCGGEFSDVFDAIAWAAGFPVPGVPNNPTPAQVVNLSLGGMGSEPCSADEDAFLASLLSATGLRAIVAAAGNAGGDANLNFPSSCPSTISVTATSDTGNRTTYSNYGTSVDIAAPGGDRGGLAGLVYVLWNTGRTVAGAYAIGAGGGTSFAAPMVSGVASLMLGVAPQLSPQEVRSIIQSTKKPFPPSSKCTMTSCGKGIVNAEAAVAAALSTVHANEVPVVEYFNAGFGHYFMSAQPDEIAGLDAGAYGGAFARTGASFNAWDAQVAGTQPVCRFFTTAFAPRSSHFYTADPAECAGVKLNADWQYEKIAFYIAVPTAGACPAGTVPVYRMYNNGQTGAPNHRFTTSLATYQEFTTQRNWSGEGVRFCAPQ
ncbi:MAG: S8 family peptidase [Burkholderiales bacterium]